MEQQQKIVLTPEQEAEQKQYKQTKELFRYEIRSRVSKQKDTKAARRSDNMSYAQQMTELNRIDLRNHYAAYAKFRGKELKEPTKKGDDGRLIHEVNYEVVTSLIKEYGGEAKKTVPYNS